VSRIFLDTFFSCDTVVDRAGLNDLNWKFTLALFALVFAGR